MVASSLLICLTVPGLALAGSAWTLGLVLFVFGAAVGAMDCTMNVQAVIVEREARRVMMSGFHAFFSIGGFLGAATMTVLLSAQLPPLASVLIGVCAMLLVMLLSASYWHSERMPHDTPMLAPAAWHRAVHRRAGVRRLPRRRRDARLERSVFSDVRRVDASRRLCDLHPDHDRRTPVRRCAGGTRGPPARDRVRRVACRRGRAGADPGHAVAGITARLCAGRSRLRQHRTGAVPRWLATRPACPARWPSPPFPRWALRHPCWPGTDRFCRQPLRPDRCIHVATALLLVAMSTRWLRV